MPTTARKRHRIGTGGPWGTGLLLLGVAVLAQGVGYGLRSEDSIPPAIDRLMLPIQAWAVLWVAAGLWCVLQALTPPQKHTDVWPVVGITCLWAAAYAVHWFILGCDGDWTSDWSTAVGWGGLACLIISWARCVNPPTAGPR